MQRSNTLSLLIACGLSLQAFGAVYQPKELGFLSASPGVLVLVVAAIFSVFCLPRASVARDAWWMLIWGLLISTLSFVIFGWNSLYASKIIPLMLLSLVWLSPVLCIDHLNPRHLRVAVVTGLTISAIGYVASDLHPSMLNPSIKAILFGDEYGVYYDSRPRGFMTETSHFATLLGRFAIVWFLLVEAGRKYSGIRLIPFMIAVAVLLVMTGSKGAAISVIAALLSISLSRKHLPYLLLLIPLAWLIAEIQFEAILFDIENFTSTATRLGLWVAGVAASTVNPLGYGYYGFYGAVQYFGTWSMDLLMSGGLSGLPLLFIELKTIVEDLTSVSLKTTLLDFGVVFGLPFWLLLLRLLRRIDVSDPRARAGLAYFLISGLSTAGHESISFFFGLAVLVRYFPNRDLATKYTSPARLKASYAPVVAASHTSP